MAQAPFFRHLALGLSLACAIALPASSASAADRLTQATLSEQFRQVVFRTESGQRTPIIKWRSPIIVRMDGAEAEAHRADVDKILRDLAGLTNLPIHFAQPGEPANMMIHFLPTAAIRERLKLPGINCGGTLSGGRGVITNARVFISTDPAKTKHCIAEEITQVMGLPNDTSVFSDSLFNDHPQADRLDLSLSDKYMVRVLYDKRIPYNAPERVTMPIARKVIGELLAKPNSLNFR